MSTQTKKKFFVTFGQTHPLRDGYIEIHADTYGQAHDKALEIFGQKFSFIRGEDAMDEAKLKYFPAGKIGNTVITY